jgi:hypothetical protein
MATDDKVTQETYVPPKVWKWESENGGQWSKVRLKAVTYIICYSSPLKDTVVLSFSGGIYSRCLVAKNCSVTKTNRPIAGATHDKELAIGKHPLQLYSLGTPNGQKVTIMLEELLEMGIKEAEYDAWLISISGDQFGSGFVAANPNSKIPALMDHSAALEKPQRVFESGAILMFGRKVWKRIFADRALQTC